MSVPSQKPRRVGKSCVAAEATARAGYRSGGKTFGHRAEILADDSTLLATALEGNEPKKIAEGIAYIGSLGCRNPDRDPIEPIERHDVIYAQDSGVAHIGADRRNKRRETPASQRERIDRGQTPILSGLIERVRRRADRCPGRHQLLVCPGLSPVRVGPDSEVAINPNRQSAIAARRRGGGELAVGFPLQELKEFDPVAMCVGEVGDLA